MIRLLVTGVKHLFGLHHPGRNLRVYPDDVFIVSYPKSGNTWTRFLIANLLYPETPADFSNINRLTPDPEASSKRELERMPRPRMIKSHQYFDPRYARVICIVRDPRDVVLSSYYFQRKRGIIDDQYPLDRFAARFIAGDTGPYGSWGDNVASWLVTRQNRPGFVLLRYEDMLEDTARELNRVASFLELPADAERIANAVRRSAADEMRKLEKAQAHLWSSTKSTRKDVPFVRNAKGGGWRTGLPEAAVAEVEGAWGHLMTHLGYALQFPGRTTNFDSGFAETMLKGPSR